MRSHPETPSIHIVKIGGEQAANIEANRRLLEELARTVNGELMAVVSALRGPRNGGFNTTDRLIEGARTAQPIEAVDAVADWTQTIESAPRAVINAWRAEMKAKIQRALDANIPFTAQPNSSDWRASLGEETISITGMGEDLAARIYNAAASNNIEFVGGYDARTGHERGYSDHTAILHAIEVANQGAAVTIHIHKNHPCMTANPDTSADAELITDIWQNGIEDAFSERGYAFGVLQEGAVSNLINSGLAINVLIYNPNRPNEVTTVHFNQRQSGANVEALAA